MLDQGLLCGKYDLRSIHWEVVRPVYQYDPLLLILLVLLPSELLALLRLCLLVGTPGLACGLVPQIVKLLNDGVCENVLDLVEVSLDLLGDLLGLLQGLSA